MIVTWFLIEKGVINLFVPNAPFLHRQVFWCFQGVDKECIGYEWAKLNGAMQQNIS